MGKVNKDSDRERILCNIAAVLANELAILQMLPSVKEYIESAHSKCHVKCKSGWLRKEPFKKGDVVLCQTSMHRSGTRFLVSFVEEPSGLNATSLVLRAIGTEELCNYGNESFVEITGIQKKMLWEGPKWSFYEKLIKVVRGLDTNIHRFRGSTFSGDGEAAVSFGECFGGSPDNPTKPYTIRVFFKKNTSLKNIRQQLVSGGFGARKFEPVDKIGPGEG